MKLIIDIPEEEYFYIKKSDEMSMANWASKECMLNAIKNGVVIEKQPCEDCISREAVDEYITNLLSGYLYDEERTRLEELTAFVWELPSVQPTRTTGKWETFVEDYNKCSKCGEMGKFYRIYKYCPNCGAKMNG